MRIVSLLPSATEIVCALGLGDELVGVTHECDWPPEVVGKPVMTSSVFDHGSSSSADIHRLVSDSVHGGSSLYALDDADITVVSLEPTSLEGIFNSISTVGAMTDAEDAAVDLVESLRSRLGVVETRVHERRQEGHEPPRVVGVEWLDPPFAVGHWVPEQIRRAGGWDLLGQDGEASRQTDWEAIAEVDPEMLVLMPCGFHLQETVDEWARTA